jgi:hypothetical protein
MPLCVLAHNEARLLQSLHRVTGAESYVVENWSRSQRTTGLVPFRDEIGNLRELTPR